MNLMNAMQSWRAFSNVTGCLTTPIANQSRWFSASTVCNGFVGRKNKTSPQPYGRKANRTALWQPADVTARDAWLSIITQDDEEKFRQWELESAELARQQAAYEARKQRLAAELAEEQRLAGPQLHLPDLEELAAAKKRAKEKAAATKAAREASAKAAKKAASKGKPAGKAKAAKR
eukprot:TRINITY_DN15768_c0_g1_i1.p2 TRINITY_DN15768_c0_g1~~TRINITY_DN15768_c0_g1_i1.p2  ORF type:complete len:176 (+),score=36.29 TRINITY_DN15768_c0_g1_i1:106-633(+)